MRVQWEDDTEGKGHPVLSPADLAGVVGGTVTIRGRFPDKSRTSWSLHLGNYVTRGGQVQWERSG